MLEREKGGAWLAYACEHSNGEAEIGESLGLIGQPIGVYAVSCGPVRDLVPKADVVGRGARDMAQWVTCLLLHKFEDLNADPQHP